MKLFWGDVVLDTEHRTCHVAGLPVCLQGKEFSLAALMLENVGKTLSFRDILYEVWGKSYGENNAEYRQYIRVKVGIIRKKLGGDFFTPVSGVGYYTPLKDATVCPHCGHKRELTP